MDESYLLKATTAVVEKADHDFSMGMKSALQLYKLAAKNYRQLASLNPSKKNQYLELASEYEQKSNSQVQPVQYSNLQNSNNNQARNNFAGNASPSNQNVRTSSGNQQEAKLEGLSEDEEAFAAKIVGVGEEDKKQILNDRRKILGDTKVLTFEEAVNKLNGLTGLEGVKEKVGRLISTVKYNKRLKDAGLPIDEGFSQHLVFTGNPGTGKTTVARIMGQIYRSLGFLEHGHVVEVSRADLVAGFIGGTAIKTTGRCTVAYGGILFVDEAYALDGGDGKDFGKEAIDTILKQMEDHRDELIVIMAGYTREMESLLEMNPGLKSRFNNKIEFNDYSVEELWTIFKSLCAKTRNHFNQEFEDEFLRRLNDLYNHRDKNFANARTLRNIYQAIKENLGLRMENNLDASIEELTEMKICDLPDFRRID